ncbi:hypothetical protein AAFF_G00034370 [Aldrovandia affinis]|uniref:Uncharacterized protein n=1 Tax=Aldrovandia affinis TaxID=143900 RepID=A0AAD7WFZ8_9TELE|nr:hypothetical protein AAFF_G00034370 [Aldrovandia affinis]
MELSQALVAKTMENLRESYRRTSLTNRLLEATGGIAYRCQEPAANFCQGAQLEGACVPSARIALQKRNEMLSRATAAPLGPAVASAPTG